MQDPGTLLALMQQFSPERQQQEQLQLQAMSQQLALAQAQEQRQAETHAALQAQAQQLNPLQVQLQQAALARIPQEQEAAQLAQESARFGLDQSRAMAPLLQQQLGAQIAAAQAAPAHQAGMLDIQRQQLAQAAAQQAAEAKAQQEKTQLSRYGMGLEALQKGVPGIALDPTQLAQMSGGALRPAGTEAALNQLVASDPAEAQKYHLANPEVPLTPDVAKILAQHAVAGTGAQGALGTPPMTDLARSMQLHDVANVEQNLAPTVANWLSPVGPIGPMKYMANWAGQQGAGALNWLGQQIPSEEAFAQKVKTRREALQKK